MGRHAKSTSHTNDCLNPSGGSSVWPEGRGPTRSSSRSNKTLEPMLPQNYALACRVVHIKPRYSIRDIYLISIPLFFRTMYPGNPATAIHWASKRVQSGRLAPAEAAGRSTRPARTPPPPASPCHPRDARASRSARSALKASRSQTRVEKTATRLTLPARRTTGWQVRAVRIYGVLSRRE